MLRRRRGNNPFNQANLLIANALVNLNENGIVGVASVTERTNSGIGGANYDADTPVGTGPNLKPHPSGSCLFYGASGDYVSTPDSAPISITGDIDLRVKANGAWSTSDGFWIAKWTVTGNQGSYQFRGSGAGGLVLEITPSGGLGDAITYTSTDTVSFLDYTDGWVRVSLDVDNGANSVAIFYTSADGENWIQLGNPVLAAITSIFNSTAILEIGAARVGTINLWEGLIFEAEIYAGINGTLVAHFNAIDAGNTGATSFPSSATGETWTLNGNTFIQNTGHKLADDIGSVALETTAGQDISEFTAFFVVRFKDASPGADQYLFDARSNATKSVSVYTDNTNSDRLTLDAGGTPIALTTAYNTNFQVISLTYSAGSATLSDGTNTVTGNPGTEILDYITLGGDLSGNSLPKAMGDVLFDDRIYNATEFSSVRTFYENGFRV